MGDSRRPDNAVAGDDRDVGVAQALNHGVIAGAVLLPFGWPEKGEVDGRDADVENGGGALLGGLELAGGTS